MSIIASGCSLCLFLQIAAMQAGLLKVVPQAVLDLLTWQEVEKKVCGDPEISVEALKRLSEEFSYLITSKEAVMSSRWDYSMQTCSSGCWTSSMQLSTSDKVVTLESQQQKSCIVKDIERVLVRNN